MSEELKPVQCGCGGEAYYEAYENYNFGSYIAHIMICDKCGMRTAEWPSKAEAIEAWNRAMRIVEDFSTVERTAKAEYSNSDGEYLCSECGRVVQIEDTYCCGCGARLEWE